MKNMIKKLLAVSTALVMIFASVIAISASTSGTITFNTGKHDVNGVTFNIYQMMNATASGDNVAYVMNKDFIDFFNNVGVTTNDAAYQYVKENVTKEGFQDEVKKYVKNNSVTAKEILTGVTNKKEYKTNQLEYGYYAIIPSGDRYSSSFTTLSTSNQNVYLKGITPDVDKTVNGNEWDSAQVGDTVSFKVTSMVPNMTGYDSYTFKLTDTMSNGLTVTEDALHLTVKIGNTILNPEDYNVTVNNQNITVEINDFIKYKNQANEQIIFTYDVVLNENAVSTNPETNTANVHWGNNPGSLNNGTPDTVKVVTHKLTITKKDNSGNSLANAEFELFRGANVSTGTKLSFINLDNGKYRVAKAGETGISTLVTPGNGVIEIEGLDDGDYRLVETKAPDGYNKLKDPLEIKIVAISNNQGQTITVTGNTLNVINKAGTLLPETGGMGTILFTFVGTIGIVAISYSFIASNKKKKEIKNN